MIPITKNNYLRQSGTGPSFKIDINKIKGPFGNYYQESMLAAEEIYSLKEGDLHIFYSGGIDSEYALSVFVELGMSVIPTIIKLSNYNYHDIKYALEFCNEKQLIPKIIDIDFDEFVKSGKILEVARESRSSVYHRPATAYAASLVDGTVLFGDGEPYIRLNSDTNTWNLEIDEHDYAVFNYLNKKNIPCVPHFNRFREGMLAAYMLDPRMKELAEHKHPGKLGSNSSKMFMYNRHSPFKLFNRPKFTGYEYVENTELFDQSIIKQLKEEGQNYTGLVAFDYHVFIREYIDV